MIGLCGRIVGSEGAAKDMFYDNHARVQVEWISRKIKVEWSV